MHSIMEIINNKILWVAILSWAAAQFIKIVIEFCKTRKFNIALLMSSGGMPSSHTSFVVAMSTTIGFTEGFSSSFFAISAVLSFVVMYDASGVRRAAGKQARAINIIIENIENTGVVFDEKLKELLGHSPIEVAAGALLGIIISAIFAM